MASTHETWTDVKHTEAVYLPEQIEIGLDEIAPITLVIKPEEGFYIISGNGALERNRAGYAYAETAEGVLRTFAMRPAGGSIVGLVHHITTAHYTVKKRTERVVTSRVKQVKQEVHQKFVPAVLTISAAEAGDTAWACPPSGAPAGHGGAGHSLPRHPETLLPHHPADGADTVGHHTEPRVTP